MAPISGPVPRIAIHQLHVVGQRAYDAGMVTEKHKLPVGQPPQRRKLRGRFREQEWRHPEQALLILTTEDDPAVVVRPTRVG